MTEQFDNFLSQIRSLPDLVRTETPLIEARMRRILSTPEIYGIRQIILTGSGDSWIAALAAAPAIRAWTGLPVQALVAMEAARYVDSGRPPLAGRNRGLLVVALSNSGEAARVVEATRRLRALGAITLAVTAHDDSRLGSAAERIVNVTIPPGAPSPGTRSYVASLLALFVLGIRIAEVLMCLTMDEANALRQELAGLAGPLAASCHGCESTIAARVPEWDGFRAADILGSGPVLGSAAYTAAKLVEAAGIHAAPQDAEEFHHLNYFADHPETIPVVLFAPSRAASFSRTRELIGTLADLGRPHLVISDDDDPAPADRSLLLPAVREIFAPIVHVVPGALIAAFWAMRRGVVHYRGHTGRWRGARDAGLVRSSAIELKVS